MAKPNRGDNPTTLALHNSCKCGRGILDYVLIGLLDFCRFAFAYFLSVHFQKSGFGDFELLGDLALKTKLNQRVEYITKLYSIIDIVSL